MLRALPIVAAAALLGACGSESSGEFTTADGETGEYEIDNSTGETSATIKTADGTATMRSGANVPIDLPAGFSLYPGAQVLSNTVVDHGDGKGTLVMMQSDDDRDELSSFYREQAEKAGVDIQLEMTANDMVMLGGESADGTTFSFSASPGDDGKTSAQLIVGTKR